MGAPITFSPKDELPSALELAVGALAADLLGSLQRVCRLRRIAFDQAEFSLRFTLDNALTYVGVVGEEGHPGISNIDGVLYVACAEEELIKEAWQEAMLRSPLLNTLQKAVDITLRLNVTP